LESRIPQETQKEDHKKKKKGAGAPTGDNEKGLNLPNVPIHAVRLQLIQLEGGGGEGKGGKERDAARAEERKQRHIQSPSPYLQSGGPEVNKSRLDKEEI